MVFNSFEILSVLWIVDVFGVLYVPCVEFILILSVSIRLSRIVSNSFRFFRLPSHSLRFFHILWVSSGFFRISRTLPKLGSDFLISFEFFSDSFEWSSILSKFLVFSSFLCALCWIFSDSFGFYEFSRILSDSFRFFRILSYPVGI